MDDEVLADLVRKRAKHRCEYCQLPPNLLFSPFPVRPHCCRAARRQNGCLQSGSRMPGRQQPQGSKSCRDRSEDRQESVAVPSTPLEMVAPLSLAETCPDRPHVCGTCHHCGLGDEPAPSCG